MPAIGYPNDSSQFLILQVMLTLPTSFLSFPFRALVSLGGYEGLCSEALLWQRVFRPDSRYVAFHRYLLHSRLTSIHQTRCDELIGVFSACLLRPAELRAIVLRGFQASSTRVPRWHR
jgi:hypothetical protein